MQPLQPYPMPTGYGPPPRRPRTFLIGALTGFLVAVVLFGIGIGIYAAATHESAPTAFTLDGSISLSDSITTYGLPSAFECAGEEGHDDIGPQSSVTVSDETGDIIATGDVVSSSGGSSGCTLSFTATDVPAGKKFYKVEVSHRGGLTYTEDEAREGISMSLGD
ncbi:hypothetical protein [Gordonia rubripertincta]|uniref:DUF4333 domain-containing protein n=1 Tax=Gordonia rubripertincta TaxID=36822 RepID=A0ABT4MZ00_GORRU|nr:hypothetical protein [Gordonia rubripertincta]MCZ4552216.1 hypothetical protein [Gordonia rubripertincta]